MLPIREQHRQHSFSSARRNVELEVVHQSPYNQETPTTCLRQILGVKRIWNAVGVKSCSLISNLQGESVRLNLASDVDVLSWIASVSVDDSIVHCLSCGDEQVVIARIINPYPVQSVLQECFKSSDCLGSAFQHNAICFQSLLRCQRIS